MSTSAVCGRLKVFAFLDRNNVRRANTQAEPAHISRRPLLKGMPLNASKMGIIHTDQTHLPLGGEAEQNSQMNRKKMAAIGVHLYTGLGILLAFTAAIALKYYHIQFFLISLWLAVIVDSTDGAMARYFDVGRVLPTFNGRRLDDLIDFLTYVFLPSMALIEFDILPTALMWVAVLPMIASAYGFSQEIAKTSESYVGFPSYWNIVFVYLYVLELSLIHI